MKQNNMAADFNGKTLPYSSEEVRGIVDTMLEEGELIAIIVRKDTDLAIQVFGPPSHALTVILKQAYEAYEKLLRGH